MRTAAVPSAAPAPRRRVLMISPHFPPDTSAGAHRVRLLAPYLPAFGWEPTIVTIEPGGYEGRLDPDLARLVPDWLRVVRSRAWPAQVTRRLGIGDLGLRSFSGLWRTTDRLLRTEPFDALFITVYPTYPALLGASLKRRYGVPFVLDYQDPWVGSWGLDVGPGKNGAPDLKSRLSRAIAERLEPRVVAAADAITAVSSRTYEDVLARVPGARPKACAAIPLGFDERDLEGLRRIPRPNPYFDEGDGLVHVCYVGTMLPKGVEMLRSVFLALLQLRDRAPSLYTRLRLHFLGTSNQRDPAAPPRVIPLAQQLGVAEVIREVPERLDYLDALNVQMRANAILLLGSTEPHYTPSKVYPAILSRRPLVAVYHAASSVVELLKTPRVDAQTIVFDEDHPLHARIGDIRDALERIAVGRSTVSPTAGGDGLEPWSARALAGTLAGVLDAVVA